MADIAKHTPVETELLKASRDLCEYLKANKQSILCGLTQRETDGLLEALHSADKAIAARKAGA